MRVGLISCCKNKLSHAAPARELYASTFFKLSRSFIEDYSDEWAILSAEHGLVMPTDIVEPYDTCLADFNSRQVERWAKRTNRQIRKRWCAEQTIFLVVAGNGYGHATCGLPLVENAISMWTQARRNNGVKKPSMGIGLIQKALKERWAF